MITATVSDPKAYWQEIRTKLNKSIAEGLKDVARLGAIGAASATYPRGTSGKTRDTLHKAIFKDVARAYNPNGQESDDGSHLLTNRNAKGRVPSGVERMRISRDSYDRIKLNMLKRAGMAKSGWLAAAANIDSKTRIPVWLRKETPNLGYAVIRKNRVTIGNRVNYSNRLLPPEAARRVAVNAMKNYHKRALRL